jgi:hypothetical protein
MGLFMYLFVFEKRNEPVQSLGNRALRSFALSNDWSMAFPKVAFSDR